MEWLAIILGVVMTALGVIGAVAPVLPGPVLSFLALPVLHWLHPEVTLASSLLWWMGGISVAIVLLDNLTPILGSRYFGSSKYGLIGGTIGLLVGLLFLGPFGVIIGPFIGTVVAELWQRRPWEQSLRSGTGTLVGFLIGALLKLTYSAVAGYYFAKYALMPLF